MTWCSQGFALGTLDLLPPLVLTGFLLLLISMLLRSSANDGSKCYTNQEAVSAVRGRDDSAKFLEAEICIVSFSSYDKRLGSSSIEL